MHLRSPSLLVAFAALLILPRATALEIKPGGTTEYTVELTASLRELAGAAKGKPAPADRALCAVAVPVNFDPARPWPVLVISATSDAKHNSSRRLMQRFTVPALAAGWIVVATDPGQPVTPEQETNGLRYALIKAALAGLQLQWPGMAQWPVAFGGFSGGAKRSAWMAAMFILDGHRPVGVFQGGCNEPAMADALDAYKPDRSAFLALPVFLSSGDQDPIATPGQHRDVRRELEHAGFRQVRLESFLGRHEVNAAHVEQALRWFREPPPPAAK